MKYYCGIGSRDTPDNICEIMMKVAERLSYTYFLRSGGASGADWAFQQGAKYAQIWLPWPNFNKQYQLQRPYHTYKLIENDLEAEESLKFHPNQAALTPYSRKMMLRNFRQIIGLNEPNSSFVVCWTASGEAEKGTGQALRIAAHYEIPIFNLAREKDLKRIVDFIEE